MKKFTLFYLLVFITGALNAQVINWSPQIKTNNAKEVVEYVGSANENNYFLSTISKSGFFSSKIETYFIKTNSNNELVSKSERLIFEDTEVIKSFVKDDKINLITKEYDKGNYVVELVVFDSKTLSEIETESKILVQFEVERSDKVIIYYAQSKDKSKYCLNYLAVDRKTSQGYLQFNVFEDDNTPLWANRFDNDFQGSLNIHDFHIENSGEVYLYAINKIPITKKTADYKLVVVKINESDSKEAEFNISLDGDISSMSFHVLNPKTIFLATQYDKSINTYKLDLEQEDVTSTNTFKIYDKEDKDFSWVLSKFYQLENGNLVLPIENKWATKYISNGAVSYSYSNANLCFALIDAEDNLLVNKTFIKRGINFYTDRQLSHGYFENPFYFTNGNEFYAIYNNRYKYDDLSGESVNWISTIKPKGSKKLHTLLLKMDETGEVKVDKLFSMKKDKRMFSAYTSFLNPQNELIISGGNVKGFSFMKFNYK